MTYRAKVVHSNQITLQQENDHIRKVHLACNFPHLALNRLLIKFNHRHNINSKYAVNIGQNNNTRSNNKNISIVGPFRKGLSKKFKMTCNSLGIQKHFKGSNTLCTLLIVPKDKSSICQKSGLIY